MIKAKVYIKNDGEYMDSNVFAEVTFASTPRIGETVHLTENITIELEEKARKTIEIAENYHEYFLGYSNGISLDLIKQENLKDLCFDDAIIVSDVRYIPNSEFVDIELGTIN